MALGHNDVSILRVCFQQVPIRISCLGPCQSVSCGICTHACGRRPLRWMPIGQKSLEWPPEENPPCDYSPKPVPVLACATIGLTSLGCQPLSTKDLSQQENAIQAEGQMAMQEQIWLGR